MPAEEPKAKERYIKRKQPNVIPISSGDDAQANNNWGLDFDEFPRERNEKSPKQKAN